MPSGSLMVAVFSCELSIFVGSWLMPTSAVKPSGSSCAVVAAFSEKLGSNGTRLQPVRPIGVVYSLLTVAFSASVSFSVVVLWPGQLVAFVTKLPVPRVPSKSRRELTSGSVGETLISK
jgi:hypothetical protein